MSEEKKEMVDEITQETVEETAEVAEEVAVEEVITELPAKKQRSRRKKVETQETKPESEWKEQVVQISRVTKVLKGGKKLSFRAIVIVGNKKGQVGVGCAKAAEVIIAIQKAIADGRKNLITVPIFKTTIPHPITGRSGAGAVMLRPASQGTGIIAGGAVRSVLELAGIEIDQEYGKRLSKKYHKKLDVVDKQIEEEVAKYKDAIAEWRKTPDAVYREKKVNKKGEETFSKSKSEQLQDPPSMTSPTQLAIFFYDVLKVGVIDKKSPRGTGEEILSKIDLPICKLILEKRGLEKIIGTYVDKLPECVISKTGRLHAHFNQIGADTGRFSSSDPNLQNIPSHLKEIRMLFRAGVTKYDTQVVDNVVEVSIKDEVETINGWKPVIDLQVGDILLNGEDTAIIDTITLDSSIAKLQLKEVFVC